ncbi:hypothetical protein Lfu02_67030 [Longispora fulva]|uniref:DUF6879 domain-containing protein n=1 Tax=Longispora fulva TaxID=619741 RepID=A0A8J7GGI4_9ACTN|nr:DUF6879 family protein [Longispora fulva]MBG6138564.1 hypothetical protein [Longispora fulva]GIG62331.1 hypothetical protein Lfu02_67030 [Longispora fulva]
MSELIVSDDNFFDQFQHTAFRLEVQPVYLVDSEQALVARFLGGDLTPPWDTQADKTWFDEIRRVTGEGRRIERVRVQPDPPTDYLRWERWAGQWNIEAGETLNYMTPAKARKIGLPIDYDWWLFDSAVLAKMNFNSDGRLLDIENITDAETVLRHCQWRDLAVHYGVPDKPPLAP